MRRCLRCFAVCLATAFSLSANAEVQPPAIRLRADAPSVDPAKAAAMTPQALGDAMLEPGHPVVDEAAVGPEGMDPPISPTASVATPIKLFFHPVRNEPAGFCRRDEADIVLELAGRTPSGGIVPTPPASITNIRSFRWVGQHGTGCAAARYDWFSPRPDEEGKALGLVRLVASLQRKAASGGHLPFDLRVNDKMGPEMAASERDHPGQHWNSPPVVFTDGCAALAVLPLGEVGYAGPSTHVGDNVLPFDWTTTLNKRPLTSSTLFVGFA